MLPSDEKIESVEDSLSEGEGNAEESCAIRPAGQAESRVLKQGEGGELNWRDRLLLLLQAQLAHMAFLVLVLSSRTLVWVLLLILSLSLLPLRGRCDAGSERESLARVLQGLLLVLE